jgi:hypothetical protein
LLNGAGNDAGLDELGARADDGEDSLHIVSLVRQ